MLLLLFDTVVIVITASAAAVLVVVVDVMDVAPAVVAVVVVVVVVVAAAAAYCNYIINATVKSYFAELNYTFLPFPLVLQVLLLLLLLLLLVLLVLLLLLLLLVLPVLLLLLLVLLLLLLLLVLLPMFIAFFNTTHVSARRPACLYLTPEMTLTFATSVFCNLYKLIKRHLPEHAAASPRHVTALSVIWWPGGDLAETNGARGAVQSPITRGVR